MKRKLSAWVGNVALSTAVSILPSMSNGQTAPRMGFGYANAIPIPVDDSATKAIVGALFKPVGPGPFPAVVYMSGCSGLSGPTEMMLERMVIDHFLAKGLATLIVDPFTPRNEPQGICSSLANLNEKTDAQIQYAIRGGNDAVASVKVLKAMAEIDPRRVFLMGFSYGATSSLFATDVKRTGARDAQVAGVVAFYPYCYDNVVPSRPTLVLMGDKDDWMSLGMCQAVKSDSNFDVVVYPDAFHGFAAPRGQPIDFLGHHIVFDAKAMVDAEQRVDAFMTTQTK
jgi:dienelactone hydrolase